jgi:hypothetical protein
MQREFKKLQLIWNAVCDCQTHRVPNGVSSWFIYMGFVRSVIRLVHASHFSFPKRHSSFRYRGVEDLIIYPSGLPLKVFRIPP